MTPRPMRFRDLGAGLYRDRLVDLVRVEVAKDDVRGLYVWAKRDSEPSLSKYQRGMPFQGLAAMAKGELALVYDPLCSGCRVYGCHGCHEALQNRMGICKVCQSKWKSYDPHFDKRYHE